MLHSQANGVDRMNQPADDKQLTPHEQRVWQFHRQGKDAYWIAEQYHVSPDAIAAWLLEIRRKVEDHGERKA